ncbi:TRAP transporter, 4TM/12TM fusion protein [Octadecabacter temperatus]|uniref:DctM-like transporter n=1 Tax=Octadecabacter temperatus TaxID=1458307 RepID=A0A0K0Y321_9RHOB|nr:TRAP transporter fused permease subunit [Octadecabacter temperatus]AKS45339.1 DctM-like transporter [Octadecabacter temperatus]SIN90837.1 TRAP transporter, 4TM/12TM fusion protein [Octadecabacter temperatus]
MTSMTRHLSVKNAIFLAGLALGIYHLMVVSGVFAISTMPMRLTHVMLALSLLFVIKPASERLAGTVLNSALSLVLVGATVGASIWMLTRWKPIAFSGGITTDGDFIAGVILLIVVFEAARRGIGLILALITFVFFLYPFLAPYLPGVLEGRGSTFPRIVQVLTTDTAGVYGIPVGVAATYIIVFTIFGALLSNFGAGDFFFELSVRCTRGLRAASAKSAVLFSTLIGMVSGSAAGNVAVTGTVTIPIMKREGYAPHQAAAIEAVASTGGQIMPPVMGAAAFIMAEIVGVPYTSVMAAAILPAMLFFGSAFVVVHLQAVKSGIAPNAGTEVSDEPLSKVLINGSPFIAAFGTLITMMLIGYSPFMASLWAMVVLIAGDIVWNRKIDKVFFTKLLTSISEGARSVVTISAACAAAGIIAGILGVTGLGSKIATLIDLASGGYLFLALFFTMITSIILGMGLPTTAAYLILATVVAPALVKLGVPVLTAHFFVFYYGCISTITPPVALASYVAGGIAGANVNKVGWTAAAYAATSFVLPFAFVYGPGLLMGGTWLENILAVVTAAAGTFAVAVGIIGTLTARLSPAVRLIAAAAGLCLLFQGWMSAVVGIALFLGVIILDRSNSKSIEVST